VSFAAIRGIVMADVRDIVKRSLRRDSFRHRFEADLLALVYQEIWSPLVETKKSPQSKAARKKCGFSHGSPTSRRV
jgi:hypothetical protein